MALPQPTPYPRIIRDPRIVDGEPTVAGTRIAVRHIVLSLRYEGSPEKVLESYPHLDREAVDQALAYYEAHRDEVEHDIRVNQDEA